MIGSYMGGLMVGMLAIVFFMVGVLVLIIGAIIAIFSFQWSLFAVAGVFFLLSGIGWQMLRASEKRYHANREALNLKK